MTNTFCEYMLIYIDVFTSRIALRWLEYIELQFPINTILSPNYHLPIRRVTVIFNFTGICPSIYIYSYIYSYIYYMTLLYESWSVLPHCVTQNLGSQYHRFYFCRSSTLMYEHIVLTGHTAQTILKMKSVCDWNQLNKSTYCIFGVLF